MSETACEGWLRYLALGALLLAGCRDAPVASTSPRLAPELDAAPPWSAPVRQQGTPRGMVWVPEGALIAGTPPDDLPRIADQEMPGEQLVLRGFYIDIYAYPNEEGAIPQTGVTRAQAEQLCVQQDKRLCTELEWERACKGPQNFTYEYGDRYRADACLTGRTPRMLPSGYRPACRSEFGARDLHGSVWEWTDSSWGRGGKAGLATLRGGNAVTGELSGRCANGMPRAPESSSPEVGFRCCKGPRNEAQVNLHIERGPVLDERGKVERDVALALDGILPIRVRQTLGGYGAWRVSSVWDWRPIGNEHLVVAGGCAGFAPARRCGVIVARLTPGAPELMGWVWAGHYPPSARLGGDNKQLWVYGGDRMSNFRQAVWFEWGRVRIGDIERKLQPRAK
jgi:formylglycine-generating enzyme required for sulfatase activity